MILAIIEENQHLWSNPREEAQELLQEAKGEV